MHLAGTLKAADAQLAQYRRCSVCCTALGLRPFSAGRALTQGAIASAPRRSRRQVSTQALVCEQLCSSSVKGGHVLCPSTKVDCLLCAVRLLEEAQGSGESGPGDSGAQPFLQLTPRASGCGLSYATYFRGSQISPVCTSGQRAGIIHLTLSLHRHCRSVCIYGQQSGSWAHGHPGSVPGHPGEQSTAHLTTRAIRC